MKEMKRIGIFLVLLMSLGVLSGCQTKETSSEELPYARSESSVRKDKTTDRTITTQESYQLATRITISIYDEKEAPNSIFDAIFDLIAGYEDMISRNITDSYVSRINQAAGDAPVSVPDDLFNLIHQGITYADLSQGAFDISIGPLVNLWGIGTYEAKVPESSELEKALSKVDYHKIELDYDTKTVFLNEKDMFLDLGAIAKGYIADEIKALILEKGYTNAIINLGGNVLMVGNKPNSDYWSVGIRDPLSDSGTSLGILELNDNSVVSSGVYERFFEENGVRYHHLINPNTGYPEQNDLLAISIVSDVSVDGDALSTAVFVLGVEKGYELVESLEGVEALFIQSDKDIIVTPGLKSKFRLIDDTYKLVY
ncbi:FAD:protein FMN transferase [Fusibacter tunisiensis]|uniref:FAD:protein FMN transferase n=1 Tax=Fusibacter tunisiensis TaxID=1008308 RepID=A0ABS2MR42_9FIRM|nr:FAD:protein FMN transferase [Fusibacter tunisiensis]MBM7561870.1 thiamine biosynthesis lipoprotein [Fusibacter tunisiensis]